MKLLLDTHAFIWFVEGDSQMSARARQLIEDAQNETWLSVASIWEMAIKINIGKLKLSQPLPLYIARYMTGNGIALLSIDLLHVLRPETMPLHHRDPFDRLLTAQSASESMAIVSVDSTLDLYNIQRVWEREPPCYRSKPLSYWP
jgi:PIN domain nuclease of toxin-antitoxin system